MIESPLHTLSKAERLSGKTAIATLLEKGRYVSVPPCLRVCYLPTDGPVSRILLSVPKKNFKRAVKRNLLKRRIRESYRLQKALLSGNFDIMFSYTPKEVLPFEEIRSAVGRALEILARQAAGR